MNISKLISRSIVGTLTLCLIFPAHLFAQTPGGGNLLNVKAQIDQLKPRLQTKIDILKKQNIRIFDDRALTHEYKLDLDAKITVAKEKFVLMPKDNTFPVDYGIRLDSHFTKAGHMVINYEVLDRNMKQLTKKGITKHLVLTAENTIGFSSNLRASISSARDQALPFLAPGWHASQQKQTTHGFASFFSNLLGIPSAHAEVDQRDLAFFGLIITTGAITAAALVTGFCDLFKNEAPSTKALLIGGGVGMVIGLITINLITAD